MNLPQIPFDIKEVQEKLRSIEQKAHSEKTLQNLELVFSCIDLTTLNPTDTISHVTKFIGNVNSFAKEYPKLPNVAAVCVYPNLITTVKETITDSNVQVASVAGGFPSSMTFLDLKVEETKRAVAHGADEIDIVIPLWAFGDGNLQYCHDEIKAIKEVLGDKHLKVILESGVLDDVEKIWQASVLSLEAGADFIKTSTGKMSKAATPEAAYTMSHALKWWYEKTGEKRGFKAAGGISTSDEATLYLCIVKEILGKEWLNKHLFRIGASRLANNLLSDISQKDIKHF